MNKVAKSAIGLIIATILAKILGFGREVVLASIYGVSMYSDAYITAMNIPLVIFATIGATISTVLIPMYLEVENELGEKASLKFMNNVVNIVVIICILLGILGLIFTKQIVNLFAIGFEGKTYELAVYFTKITIMGIFFTGLTYLMTAYLQINNNFIIPGIVSIPKNIIMIISIILSIKYNPDIMIWGALLGMVSEFLLLLPFVMKQGYRYSPYIKLKDKYLKKMLWLMMPVLIGVSVNQINTMVDRTLASTLIEGSVSALNYANKLNGFVMSIFILSISSVIYPMLSKLSTERNKDEFNKSVVQSINSVILFVLPISVGAIVLANPIVKLLFERGAFDSTATKMTSIAIAMYSIGMVAFGLRDILGKVFYAIQDTKTPMINGGIAMVMNIVLNLILVRYLKIAGIALATSISAIICIFLLFNSLNNKIGYFGQDKIIKTTLKSAIASIIMGVVTYFVYDFLNGILYNRFIYDAISLFGSILIGFIVYLILVVILRIDEVKEIIDSINKKLKSKSTNQ